MTKNKKIDNNTLDLGFVIDRKSKDFSFVPSWTYKRLVEKEIICCDDVIQDLTPYKDDEYHLDFWPTCGHFFVIENGCISQWVLQNTALVINAYGLNYDHEYFLPLYELLVSKGIIGYDYQ